MAALERKVLEAVGDRHDEPMSAAGLAKLLQINKQHREEFRQAIDALLASGEILQTSQGLIRAKVSAGLVAGTFRKTSSGAGFVITKPRAQGTRLPDIFIPREDASDAHTGDEVLVKLSRQAARPDGKRRGKIVDVVERATRTFVGTYLERDGQGFVQVDGSTINDPVQVGDPGAKGARPQDKVVFEMLRFPTSGRAGEGVLTEVLGPRGAPGVDTLTIIREFGLPDEFPSDVLAEARLQAERFDETGGPGRQDLQEDLLVTIDPLDARDFDDAISLTQNDEGFFRLGVHIADVSHFVPVGSNLDKEAYRRGTSVYLPDRVLPMLPELISNGLASLQRGQPRYAKTVHIEFSPEGTPLHAELCNSLIRVTQRFSYEEVLPLLKHPERSAPGVTAPVRELLARMHHLAQLLRKRRFERGALELTLPEVKLDLDNEGRVSGAHVSPHDVSHQLIEEFMLAANVAVAEALRSRKIAFLRRVHADPDEFKMKAFGEFVGTLGFQLKRYQSRPDLQKLLDKVQGTPLMYAVSYALLRSLKQAEYTPEDLGHYALAEEDYCHFTSPIRRYPDLTVHRLLDTVIQHEPRPRQNLQELAISGQHCSQTERRAERAERELTKIKLLTHMQQRIGDDLHALITAVHEYGFFCQAEEIPAEGLVHISSLDDDFYDHDMGSQSLTGRRTGRRYRLGDRVQVRVAQVDIDRRLLVFRLTDSAGRADDAASLAAAARGRPPRPSRGGGFKRTVGSGGTRGPRAKGRGAKKGGKGRGGKSRGKRSR